MNAGCFCSIFFKRLCNSLRERSCKSRPRASGNCSRPAHHRRQSRAPKALREPEGSVNPSNHEFPAAAPHFTLTQLRFLPERYGASARLAINPSIPLRQASADGDVALPLI